MARPVLLLCLAAAIGSSAGAQSAGGKAPSLAAPLIGQPCRPGSAGEIVVCGDRQSRDAQRYRLPLPDERDAPRSRVAGEASRATAQTPSNAGCGIFQGQRRCGKAEALAYGYGGGSDPLSTIVKLGTVLLDPDADIAPTVKVPDRFEHMPH